MNYYERHLGDYARDTGHLTLLEHGVYTILLDRYYATEEGIPADQAHRLARARTEEERHAVDSVLAEFFHLDENLWVSDRVEEELTSARERIEKARENGRKGGRPAKNTQKKTGSKPKPNPEETQPFQSGFENETQKKAHQAPSSHLTEANASGAAAPADPIFGTGLAFLVRKGIPPDKARPFLGKLRKEAGDVQAAAILADCEAHDISDPIPWLSKAAVNARAGPTRQPSKTLSAIHTLEAMNHGMADTRNHDGIPEAPLLGFGSDPCD